MRPDLTQMITLTDRRWREAEFDGGDMKNWENLQHYFNDIGARGFVLNGAPDFHHP
jgi:hypothetical protein